MSKKNEGMMYVPCDREWQGRFLRMCTEFKVRYENAVIEAVDEWMERRVGEIDDPFIQLMMEEKITDNWHDAENMLIRLAIKWPNPLTEEQMEKMEEYCGKFGFDPQKILDAAKADKNVRDYIKQHGSLTRVQQWLVDHMPRDYEGVLASYIIDRCCQECGVKKPTVYAAKRDLKIVSKKDGENGKWKWYWPGYENGPSEEELEKEELEHMETIRQSIQNSMNGVDK